MMQTLPRPLAICRKALKSRIEEYYLLQWQHWHVTIDCSHARMMEPFVNTMRNKFLMCLTQDSLNLPVQVAMAMHY